MKNKKLENPGRGTGSGTGAGTRRRRENGNSSGNAVDSELLAGRRFAVEAKGTRGIFDIRIAREPDTSLENVRWLTTSEAARYLRVSISSIKMMIYRGQIRVHKLGKRNRFLADELDRLITPSSYK